MLTVDTMLMYSGFCFLLGVLFFCEVKSPSFKK